MLNIKTSGSPSLKLTQIVNQKGKTIPDGVRIQVVTTATKSRSAGENARIFNTHKKQANRNPAFMIRDDRAPAEKQILEAAIRGDSQAVARALDNAGKVLQFIVSSHIENQRSQIGPMKPNSPKTLAIKKAKDQGDKVLVATGEMLSSLRYRIVSGKTSKFKKPL